MNHGIKLPVKRGRCLDWGGAFRLCAATASCVALVLSPAMAGTATFAYSYDPAGRLISVASPEHGATTYAYDPAGNMLQRSFSAEADADHDDLVVAQEVVLGLDPADPDTDHDGINDGAEVVAGTNGLDPASQFVIVSAGVVAGGAMEIMVPTVNGRRYTLQSSSGLTGWIDEDETAAVGVPGTGAVVALRDTNPAPDRKFYRVMVSF